MKMFSLFVQKKGMAIKQHVFSIRAFHNKTWYDLKEVCRNKCESMPSLLNIQVFSYFLGVIMHRDKIRYLLHTILSGAVAIFYKLRIYGQEVQSQQVHSAYT